MTTEERLAVIEQRLVTLEVTLWGQRDQQLRQLLGPPAHPAAQPADGHAD